MRGKLWIGCRSASIPIGIFSRLFLQIRQAVRAHRIALNGSSPPGPGDSIGGRLIGVNGSFGYINGLFIDDEMMISGVKRGSADDVVHF